ncbi:MAG: ATP-binding cassette domain-containing protein [Myxococcota bacterium]
MSVRFGGRLILDQITLKLPERGVVALMGPGGAGKSTLLRTIAGLNDSNSHMVVEGDAAYMGRPLGDGPRPSLMVQRPELIAMNVTQLMATQLPGRQQMTVVEQRDTIVRFLNHAGLDNLAKRLDANILELSTEERRELFILRELLADPALLCLDECMVGLADATPLLNRIRQEGKRRCVWMVTHNQEIARTVADQVMLLAGGRIQEHLPSSVFFTEPLSKAGRDWIRNGNCDVPSPEVKPEELDPQYLIQSQLARIISSAAAPLSPPTTAPLTPEPASEALGPRGFHWLEPGRYGGTPQPGIIADVQFDLAALKRVGTTILITLTEAPFIYAEQFEAEGIGVLHVPIPDMKAPSLDTATAVCEQARQLAERGAVVVYHCKAGIGRTGTMLAAQLIWEGTRSGDAIARVRSIEPRYIQSSEQEHFLVQFARAAGSDRTDEIDSASFHGLQ